MNLQPLALLRTELQQAATSLGIAPDAAEHLPSHRVILTMALDGELPAERVNGRWYFRPARLPEIAAAFGLTTTPDAASSIAA